MEKIVELVTEGKYDKLKTRIEGLVAKKVADKIEDNFLDISNSYLKVYNMVCFSDEPHVHHDRGEQWLN